MTTEEYGVIGIGNAIVDVLSQTEENFLVEQQLEKGHMTLIEAEESDRLYSKMGPAVAVSGGSAASSIAAYASLGGKAAFIGKVSNDQLGNVFKHDIKAAGVHYETAPLDDGPPTARCLIFVTPDAERTMCTFLGSSVWIAPSDLNKELIQKSQVTYLEGYLFDKNNAKKAFKEAAQMAREAGRKVALTLSDSFCVKRHKAEFLDLVQNDIDILFANESEICALFDSKDMESAIYDVKGACEIAVLTCGASGSKIVTSDKTIDISAEKVENVVDTTGAGDLYAAGFLYGLTHGKSLEQCGRIASIAAAEVITHLGGRPQRNLADLIEEKLSAA